jgi:hypothetical protein
MRQQQQQQQQQQYSFATGTSPELLELVRLILRPLMLLRAVAQV